MTRPVLVTTKHRGVFFGYTDDTSGSTVKLTDARCAIFWTADTRGFMGLAENGPGPGCRIGAQADIELRDVTAVVDVTPEAVERWESAPWGD